MLKRRLARRFPRGRDGPAGPRAAGRPHERSGDGSRALGGLGLAFDVGGDGERAAEGGFCVDGEREDGREVAGRVVREEVRD